MAETDRDRRTPEEIERDRRGETARPGAVRADDDVTRARPDDLSCGNLSRGPTPETRHPAGHVEGRDFAENDSRVGETGGVDDERDTTQGPTPETLQVMRATDDDAAAAGQPESDRDTRADVGGNQDTERTKPVDPTRRDR